MTTAVKLCSNLYVVEMLYGKIDIPKEKNVNVFIIAEHVDDKEYIRKQAMDLLVAGYRHFSFYGEKSDIWSTIFMDVFSLLFSNAINKKCEENIVSVICDELLEFAEELFDTIMGRVFVPCVNLLVYDDEMVSRQVCSQVEWLKQKSKLFHKVRATLKEMNPCGLLQDEPTVFYGVAERIAEIIKEKDDKQQVATKMARVLTESFGEQFKTEQCMEYANYICR